MAIALCTGVIIAALVAALLVGGVGSAGAATTSTALVATTPKVAIKSACIDFELVGGAGGRIFKTFLYILGPSPFLYKYLFLLF